MSKIKKRAIIAVLAAVLAAAGLTVAAKLGVNPVSNAVNTVISPVQSVIVKVFRPVKNFISFVTEMKGLKEENELLKSEVATLKKESRNQEEYKKENTRLKKLLNLTDDMTGCETVSAKIVSFEPGNWFYSLIINKGSRDGIKLADTVISEGGLIGKISEVGINWARVSTILDSQNSVGIKLTRTGDVGIAEGDTELLKNKRFKLDYISKNTSLISGELLETSGLGGIYPPGLSVGTIEEVELDSTGELVKGIVKPAANFENLYEVLVVTYWEPKNYDKNQVTAEYSNDDRIESGRSEKSLKKAEEAVAAEEDNTQSEPAASDGEDNQ